MILGAPCLKKLADVIISSLDTFFHLKLIAKVLRFSEAENTSLSP